MIDTKELRQLATACENWNKAGCPISDPYDTYPDDLFDAATTPKDIIRMVDEIDLLRLQRDKLLAALESWSPICGKPCSCGQCEFVRLRAAEIAAVRGQS